MKNLLFVVLILVLTFSLSSFAAQTTVTGILTDNMCTTKHMMPGKPNADCVHECVEHGAKYVVVADGKVFEVSGNQNQLNPLAGKKVTVTGLVKGKTIFLDSVKAAD